MKRRLAAIMVADVVGYWRKLTDQKGNRKVAWTGRLRTFRTDSKGYSAYSARRSPPGSRWRTSGPPLEGVGETADLAVPQEEGDLREAEVALLKISARQILPQASNDTTERCIQLREFSR